MDCPEGAFIVSRAFKDEIIEVVPGTHYQGCSFSEGCTFVGTGPADFVDCLFKCEKPRLPGVRTRKRRE